MTQDELKQMVGQKSVEFIEDGMIVGLGTGTTSTYMVDALGKRLAEEGLHIMGVTTSKRTADQAKQLGIPLKSINDVDHIDLTIDGADEIDKDFQGIKGGGASLLFEKIVATNSDRNIWIVDEGKMHEQLGSFPLAIEVIPYGSQQLFDKFSARGLNPVFRRNEAGDFARTDSNNWIIDLHVDPITDPYGLQDYLINQVGVVEQGLFLDVVNTVIVGHPDGPEIIHARK